MTTATILIQRAFRQDNIIGIGVTPSTNEQSEGLDELNDIINYMVGHELGELLNDWYVPPLTTAAEYAVEDPRDPFGNNTVQNRFLVPPINSRWLLNLTAATTVFLPQYPNDGSRFRFVNANSTNDNLTINANQRLIDGAASLAVDLSMTPQNEWFYRADRAEWRLCADLALGDENPFPKKYDKLLVTALSIALCPRYGREPSSTTLATYESLMTKFRAQYQQYTPVDPTDEIVGFQSVRLDNQFPGGAAFING